MKKSLYILIILGGMIMTTIGCKTSQVVANKQGVQLWSENCVRCHYAPSPAIYSDQQWDIIGTHMEVRASLTQEERIKIIEFLKSAN